MAILRRVLWVGYTLLMLWGMFQPGGPEGLPVDDKLAHFGAFLVFTVLTWWNLPGDAARRTTGAVVIGFVLAAVTEWVQGSVPGRTPELGDLVADGIGVVVGVLVLEVFSLLPRASVAEAIPPGLEVEEE